MERFFVSVRTHHVYGMLLGPFETKAQAEERIDFARHLVDRTDAKEKNGGGSVWWGFGVTGVKDDALTVLPTFNADGSYRGRGTSFKIPAHDSNN